MNADETPGLSTAARASLRYGWTALLLFLLGGLTLEFLHLIKAPWYLDHHLRRELWVLAHAHGALLALLNLVWAALLPRVPAAVSTGRWLRWGGALVPAGFFLGGIGNTETDPMPAIFLTPIGAALVLWALFVTAQAAWKAGSGDAESRPAASATPSPPGTGPSPSKPRDGRKRR